MDYLDTPGNHFMHICIPQSELTLGFSQSLVIPEDPHASYLDAR